MTGARAVAATAASAQPRPGRGAALPPAAPAWAQSLDPSRVARVLFAAVALLVALHALGFAAGAYSWQFVRLFHLEMESNVPTWFASWLWSLCALAAYGCARRDAGPGRMVWLAAALALLAMSCEEIAMVHEHLGALLRRRGWTQLAVFDVPAVVLAPALAGGLAWLVTACRRRARLSASARRWLLIGLIAMFGAAMGVDLVADHLRLAAPRPSLYDRTLLAAVLTMLEETCELIAGVAVLTGLLAQQRALEPAGVERP